MICRFRPSRLCISLVEHDQRHGEGRFESLKDDGPTLLETGSEVGDLFGAAPGRHAREQWKS